MDGVRVLVVEDDRVLRPSLERLLRQAGAQVVTAATGAEALRAVGPGPAAPFDVVVLDIGLPDSDGRDVCQAVRARGVEVPVLFLTAREGKHDLLSGYAAGGDEYLAKPFHAGELLARLGALVRRSTPRRPPAPTGLVLDPAGHAVTGPGGEEALTPTEYRLLAALLAAAGQVVRRHELVRAGWPDGAHVAENTLDQYVARLRRRTAAVGGGAAITTVHGVGYRVDGDAG
ncbi:response regulator transcription factor [uncultured Pseudokineococcus sp.]|uniref:response regulator transcription factor n=1 Tax=uncultured Pseudokineococcus sp. TaxID=1642928 RepID=UPI00262519BB|nr:response regulator transcription factor [uncultured Pseudokineococcus sp.]